MDENQMERELRDLRRMLKDAKAREDRLRAQLDEMGSREQAVSELNMVVDSVMAETAQRYGTPVLCDDGSLKGYHLQLGKFDAREVMAKWMVTATRSEDGGMLIGVQEREHE